MRHVCSLSGGRTSTGPLPEALINKYGRENVDFIFCDTGAEDEDTYRFLRDAEKDLDIKIICLKLFMPKEKGKGAEYIVCDSSDIRQDYFAWKQLTSKYGNPYIPGGKFCTDQMKTIIFKKYCNDTYGKNNFYTWLGYRFEEGNRIWGKSASNALGQAGLNNIEKTQFYLDCLSGRINEMLDTYFPSMFPSDDDDKNKGYILKAMETIKKKGFRFMSEISSFQKIDVINWWSGNPNDLTIGEHEGNCKFCPEKPRGTIMLAIKDDPDGALKFKEVVESDEVAIKENRKHASDVMYRDGVTFEWLYNKAMSSTRDEVLQMSAIGKGLAKKNTCSSGECSPFGIIHEEQIEMF